MRGLEGGRARVDESVGGKQKRMGMRQDLKLGTAHEEWMLGERQAKQENAPVPPFPYRSSVISITAMQQRHLQRPGARFDCRRPLGWVILHKVNPPHIVLTGRGEDRLTCQSRQASLRPRRPLIGAKTGWLETCSDKHLPSRKSCDSMVGQ